MLAYQELKELRGREFVVRATRDNTRKLFQNPRSQVRIGSSRYTDNHVNPGGLAVPYNCTEGAPEHRRRSRTSFSVRFVNLSYSASCAGACRSGLSGGGQ